MESYWHVDYTSLVHFQISPKMKAVEAKEENEKSFFALEPSFFEIFQNGQIWRNLHVKTFP